MADEEKTPSPPLPPKLDLSKLSARATPKPDDAEPAAPADPPSAQPSAPRPAATPPGDLPKPGPTAAPSSAAASAQAKPASVRLKPKLPPPRPVASASPTTPTYTATPESQTTKPEQHAQPEQAAAAASDKPTGAAPGTPAPANAKRETSRIPLESAQSGGPKTIRIKPVGQSVVPPPSGASTPSPEDAKRRTSRISLESALGGTADEAAGGPKTIRLKRPSEPAADKVSSPPAPDSKEAFSKTAPIAEVASDVPLTQKKTIKVKRPGQGSGGPRSAPVVRRADGGDSDAETGVAAAAMAPAAQIEDRAHWTFITLSVFSVIILIVTVYLFSAQAFGPNLSLTRLSYGAEGMELPWPGRLYPR